MNWLCEANDIVESTTGNSAPRARVALKPGACQDTVCRCRPGCDNYGYEVRKANPNIPAFNKSGGVTSASPDFYLFVSISDRCSTPYLVDCMQRCRLQASQTKSILLFSHLHACLPLLHVNQSSFNISEAKVGKRSPTHGNSLIHPVAWMWVDQTQRMALL